MVYNEKYAWMHDPFFMDSLTKMRADAERYSEQLLQSIAEAKKQHSGLVQQAHENMTSLVKTEQNLIAEAHQLHQVKLQEKQEIEQLSSKLAELRVKEERLPEVLESYQQQVRLAKQELDEKIQEVQEQEKQINQRVQRATMGIDFYRTRFGLQFEKLSDSGIRVIFTNVDPKDHERRFIFSLAVDDDDYQLLECRPKLTGVQPLVDELNASNNVSRFVVQMRKKFQEKCIC